MKLFLKNLLIFTCVLLAYFVINFAINQLIITNSKPNVDATRILIAGDSQIEKALNPALFESANNISQLAEPYVLTYWKLKNIFKYQKPDTLLLGFAHHNISAFNDLKFSHPSWVGEMFKRSYTIEEFDEIDSKIEVDYEAYREEKFKRLCFYPHFDHYNYHIGEYSNDNSSHVKLTEKIIRRHFYFRKKLLGVSGLSVEYLNKIITLCKENNIVPILISTPVYPSYFDKLPETFKNSFKDLSRQLKTDNRALVLDYTERFYQKNFYLDPDHLNAKGSNKFTKELIKELASN